MAQSNPRSTGRHLNRRLAAVEIRLSALATKEDLRTVTAEAVAPLPTRDEMHAAVAEAVAPLPTREDVRAAIDTAITKAVAPLPTREDVRAAIDTAIAKAVAPLPTREEMHATIDTAIAEAVAPLATRDELYSVVREEGERTRRHFDVVAEDLRGDIRLLAEGQIALYRRDDDLRTELKGDIAQLDRRVMRLEAGRE